MKNTEKNFYFYSGLKGFFDLHTADCETFKEFKVHFLCSLEQSVWSIIREST